MGCGGAEIDGGFVGGVGLGDDLGKVQHCDHG
jgi:hypothetical protein